jgi:hypothetical protein
VKLTINSHHQFPHIFLKNGVCLSLGFLFIQPLIVQALPTTTVNEPISQQTKQSRKIPYNRLIIGGISLDMSENNVRKILGKPLTTKNGYEAVAGKTRTLQYTGLTVKLLEDVKPTGKFFVYEITTTSPKYPTVDGVKVGDNLAKVTRIYGKPESSSSTNLSYAVDNSSPTYFNFTSKNGKVTKIVAGDFLG